MNNEEELEEQETPIVSKNSEAAENILEQVIYNTNDTFKKTYDFRRELGITVDISIKMPNAFERATLVKEQVGLFDELFAYVDPANRIIYDTLTLIEKFGKYKVYKYTNDKDIDGNPVINKQEIPDYFSMKRFPREDLVTQIWQDYQEWRSRFLG
ncbi:hypothetical protein RND61_15055 [Streptomyces sp. TRM76323]|uniref:Uncharacterized protein n=1 Tax=Streptomyces tamarix TaxID=3078565 RepID=A0ABU3QKU8_9ACTN|nr:hypothetical protein [Streptomyces tamarix]MDT9683382.1 hypothetical protein [Streptomyces tamarix]